MFFSDTGGKAERGTPYYIHTRVRRARTRAYAQGKGRGNTGKVKKMRKGNQNGNPKKRKNYAIRNNSINILRGTF